MTPTKCQRNANVTQSGCQKYADVTPSQCQKNANRDTVWMLSIPSGDLFLEFLRSKGIKNNSDQSSKVQGIFFDILEKIAMIQTPFREIVLCVWLFISPFPINFTFFQCYHAYYLKVSNQILD